MNLLEWVIGLGPFHALSACRVIYQRALVKVNNSEKVIKVTPKMPSKVQV